MKVTFEMVIGTFTCIALIFVLIALYGDRQDKTKHKVNINPKKLTV